MTGLDRLATHIDCSSPPCDLELWPEREEWGVDVTCQRKPFDCINEIVHCDKSRARRQNLCKVRSLALVETQEETVSHVRPSSLNYMVIRQNVTTSSRELVLANSHPLLALKSYLYPWPSTS